MAPETFLTSLSPVLSSTTEPEGIFLVSLVEHADHFVLSGEYPVGFQTVVCELREFHLKVTIEKPETIHSIQGPSNSSCTEARQFSVRQLFRFPDGIDEVASNIIGTAGRVDGVIFKGSPRGLSMESR